MSSAVTEIIVHIFRENILLFIHVEIKLRNMYLPGLLVDMSFEVEGLSSTVCETSISENLSVIRYDHLCCQ